MIKLIHLFDTAIYQTIRFISSDYMTEIMLIITNFASAFMLILLSMVLLYKLKNKKMGIYIVINLICVFLLNQILKLIFSRDRPELNPLIEASGFSFPSGHSMVSMGFYGFLIYLIYKNVENKKLKILFSSLLAFFILLIGMSRIYLGVHYATDVLGGFLFGFMYLLIYINIIYKRDIFRFSS